ncbi:MAG: hypothetical protein AAF721_18105 [Myxococcota bacterium]
MAGGIRTGALGFVLLTAACGGDDAAGNDAATGAATEGGDASGDTGTAVSYSADVRPIFGRYGCIVCHHDNSAIDIDIGSPFEAPNGLVGSENTWAVAHPEGNTPALNVEAGAPDESFLLDKIGDPMLVDPATAGAPMPLRIERLTADELANLRAWIDAGAANDAVFEEQIRPIFGDESTLGGASGKCTWCHHSFPGGQRPNLTDPFDPTNGAVGVASSFDPERMLIAPGNAADSVLVLKVEATEPGALGSPMPQQFDQLTADEVETVRLWIEQGAQDN